jgi:hypothetical protein
MHYNGKNMRNLTIIFVLFSLNLIFGQTAVAPAGAGTSGDPYRIATLENLYWVSQNSSSWSSNFVQTSNIDASASSGWNSGKGWTPIGNSTTKFNGNYNGQGHTISGLYINNTTNYSGLFGYTSGGTISNLGVLNVNITDGSGVGALVGTSSSTISNCHSSGSITGVQYIGGLIGMNNYPASRCYSSCSVTGSSQCGGLIGRSMQAVTNCYSTGNVTRKSGSTFTDFGSFMGYNGSAVNYCYSTGSVSVLSGTAFTSNGFIGSSSGGTYTANFYDQETSGQTSGTGATAATTAQMKTSSTFSGAGWNITAIWNMCSTVNNNYPYLLPPATAPAAGDGSVGSPYQIAEVNNLYWLSMQAGKSDATGLYWSRNYIQTEDIDASASTEWNNGLGWTPIGNSSNKFTGTYNGQGHTITGIYYNISGTDYVGLFGYTSGGTISNLGSVNVNITAHNYSGGLIGYNNATISNCYSTGTLNGFQYVGGLVGEQYNHPMSSCYSTCNVKGAATCAGLIGHGYNSSISNCYSRGSVTRVAGYNNPDFGGFAGYVNACSINTSYSTGYISVTDGTALTTSGFLPLNSGGTYNANFYDTETSGQASSLFATGQTTANMKINTTFLSVGWDYNTWNMDTEINDGYPYLKWQNTAGTPLPVELTSFTVSVNGKKVVLAWQTATEKANYGFNVERSAVSDNMQWETIGSVKGNGNSNSPKYYSFVDAVSLKGKIQYRLKQIDLDGKFEYSNTVEVSTGLLEKFELEQNYPNPFNPSTTISYSIPKDALVSLKIYNMLGEEVKSLFDGRQKAGFYSSIWSGDNNAGNKVSSGTYIYVVKYNDQVQSGKMTFLK